MADTDLGTHRQPMAKRRNRRPHAMELQALNGLGFPLTVMRVGLSTGSRARRRYRGLSGPVFSGPDDRAI